MKKIITLILILVITTMCFAACGGKNADPEGEVVVMIQNVGYGYEWLENVAAEYKKDTGTAVTVNATAVQDKVAQSLLSPKNNSTDLYFGIRSQYYTYLAQGASAVKGYDKVFVDISDIFSAASEGYGNSKKISEMIYPYFMNFVTYKDGNQYFAPWATGYNGIVYNAKLFSDNGFSVPNTTSELLKLCADIKAKNLTKEGNKIYAFTYAQDYFKTLMGEWYAQIEGYDAYLNFCHGKDADGLYTAEIFKQFGFYSAVETAGEILDADKQYSNPNCTSYNFTQSQLKFLNGEAFMNPNGDWLEREAASNFTPGSLDIQFMKTPINSAIIEKLSSVESDTELSEIVNYIDGKIAKSALSKTYADDDLAKIEEARKMVATNGQLHVSFIPSYSNNITGAKAFLKYCYSKKAQQIMLQYANGNTFPIKYDFSSDATLSSFQSSKYANMNENSLFVGQFSNTPMAYNSSLGYFEVNEKILATVKSSASYKSAFTIVTEIYNSYNSKWNTMMTQAGVSN